ncbi:hypothetical protein GVX81_05985 [[Haemophilus] felis]|uniref:Uncharacterized protein n=1 Tax=[Haemophilus] felis TaxID=123822 RepID=A0A1T0B3L2_9PAST|nr:hypothetical protein [[Haemophilus] felis]NBI40684.1 hypothetical protein [[Haemophilus] felis]NBI42597.1 hypothetical protein [[Haemophilus] felis]OOS04674.1 hypothetical protein B0188_04645 [[Haemophilus] felis]
MTIEKIVITEAKIHALFVEISKELGFSDDDILHHSANIADLIEMWTEQKFIEVYKENIDRVFGRIKDSSLAKGAVPYYLGIYHARVDKNNENDPLIVLTFRSEREDNIAEIRFMATHDILFGTVSDKLFQQRMKAIRQKIDELVQRGNI